MKRTTDKETKVTIALIIIVLLLGFPINSSIHSYSTIMIVLENNYSFSHLSEILGIHFWVIVIGYPVLAITFIALLIIKLKNCSLPTRALENK